MGIVLFVEGLRALISKSKEGIPNCQENWTEVPHGDVCTPRCAEGFTPDVAQCGLEDVSKEFWKLAEDSRGGFKNT